MEGIHLIKDLLQENSYQRNKFLSNQNKIKATITGRVEVVEGEFTSSEWQTTENGNATVNHPKGSFQNMLEGSLSENHHEGDLVVSGNDETYQCIGTHCSETCNINLYQEKIDNTNLFTNRQHHSSVLLGKAGGNSQPTTATSIQENMGLSVSQSNSSYSRVLTEYFRQIGNPEIMKIQAIGN